MLCCQLPTSAAAFPRSSQTKTEGKSCLICRVSTCARCFLICNDAIGSKGHHASCHLIITPFDGIVTWTRLRDLRGEGLCSETGKPPDKQQDNILLSHNDKTFIINKGEIERESCRPWLKEKHHESKGQHSFRISNARVLLRQSGQPSCTKRSSYRPPDRSMN